MTILPIHIAEIKASGSALQQVAAINTACWKVDYRGIVPQQYLEELTVEQTYQRIRGLLEADASYRLLGAFNAGAVCGYVGTRILPGTTPVADLHALYLNAEHRGAGIAQQLVRAAEAHFTSLKFSSYRIWVLENNQRALRFYQKCGARLTGAQKIVELTGGSAKLIELIRSTSCLASS